MFKYTTGLLSKLAICALVLTSSVLASIDVETDKGVYVLTSDNFKDFVKSNENVLVEFYAPWCGHCKNLEPEYIKAAEALEGKPAKLAKVDATVHESLGTEFGISGFPTLKYFVNGELSEDYDAPRTSDAIVAWVNKRIVPIQVIDEPATIVDMLEANQAVAVAYVTDIESPEAVALKRAYSKVSFPFVITGSKLAFAKADGIVDAATTLKTTLVVVNKDLPTPKSTFSGDLTSVDEIIDFLNSASQPIVFTLNAETSKTLFGAAPADRHYAFLFGSKSDMAFASTYSCFRDYALAIRSGKSDTTLQTPYFVHIDTAVSENAGISGYFGVPSDVTSQVYMFDMRNGTKKYRSDTNPTCDSIKAFVNNYRESKLSQFFKSEPIPDNWDAKPVKVLVGNNFNSVVNGSKHAFVEFYAPWCGHCKQLAPIWDELAEKYAANTDVLIANIESTANEVNGVEIQGFPTIIYFSKSDNATGDYVIADVMDTYNGADRGLDSLAQWVESKINPSAKKEEVVVAPSDKHHTEL